MCISPWLRGHRESNVSPQTPSRDFLFKAAQFQHFGAFTEEPQRPSTPWVTRAERADPAPKGSWLFTLAKINFLDVPRICSCHAVLSLWPVIRLMHGSAVRHVKNLLARVAAGATLVAARVVSGEGWTRRLFPSGAGLVRGVRAGAAC